VSVGSTSQQLPQPPKTEDKREWYRWYYKIFELVNNLYVPPAKTDDAPTGVSYVGKLYCTASGILYIYTATGWQKVGAQ